MRATTRHRLKNALHTLVLVAGMALIAGAAAWVVWGPAGLPWAAFAVAVGLMLTPKAPPGLVMRMVDATPIPRPTFPEGYGILDELARRAELERVPQLYHLPAKELGAFSVGTREDGAIALSDGALRSMTPRELAAVLAHEVGHIAVGDVRLMMLADAMSRVTSFLAWIGMALLLLYLPAAWSGEVRIPMALVLVLVLSPTVAALLQLALARSREYAADERAAELTGDPHALAQALQKLERAQGRMWEQVMLPRRRAQPNLLRTHPSTDSRVARLKDMAEDGVGEFDPLIPPERPWAVPEERVREKRGWFG